MHEAGACKHNRSSFVGVICAFFLPVTTPSSVSPTFSPPASQTHTTYLISLCCEEPRLSHREELRFPALCWRPETAPPPPNTRHTEGEPPAGLSHAKRTFLKLNLQAGQLNKTAPYTFIAQQRLLAWQRPLISILPFWKRDSTQIYGTFGHFFLQRQWSSLWNGRVYAHFYKFSKH